MITWSETTAQRSTRREKLLRYLQALYPPGMPGELLAFVKKPFKRVFGRPDELEAFADRVAALDEAGYDTYLTINTIDGPAVRSRGRRARGCEKEVLAVVALVADVDAGPKPGHNYPTQRELYTALLEMPRYPSLIVVSGRKTGGLHVYWLLDKPYLIRSDADRQRIKSISRRWQELLRSKLAGRDLDSTYDLVRLLRPIGSTNHKYGTIVLEAHDLDPALRAEVEAKMGANLDDVPYDRDSIDAIESVLPPPPPVPEDGLPPIVLNDEQQAKVVSGANEWLSRREGAVAATHGGGGGDAHTYNTAVCLVHGFGLPVEAAFPLLCRWNQRCVPPWPHDLLLRKLQCASIWEGNKPRGWMWAKVTLELNECRTSRDRTDLNTGNCDISTALRYCPTPKRFIIPPVGNSEAIRIAMPCGNRRKCEACRSNWVAKIYVAICRSLAETSACGPGIDAENGQLPAIYAGEVDDAGLRAACKYLERGKKQRGACAHYFSILRPGGKRLMVALAPYRRGCQPFADRPLLHRQIHQALQAVPLDGKRGITHSLGWFAEKKPAQAMARA